MRIFGYFVMLNIFTNHFYCHMVAYGSGEVSILPELSAPHSCLLPCGNSRRGSEPAPQTLPHLSRRDPVQVTQLNGSHSLRGCRLHRPSHRKEFHLPVLLLPITIQPVDRDEYQGNSNSYIRDCLTTMSVFALQI